jgi:hypothetical protein
MNTVREFTPSGVLVQTLATPPPPEPGDTIRDAAVTADGRLAIYNGTFNPALTVLDPATGSFQNFTFPGWSTTNTLVGGGIATLGNIAFATDMNTGSGPENGLIRFDTVTGAGQRFAAGRDFIDVAVGFDGLVYGLHTIFFPGGHDVAVHDPVTLQQLRDVTLAGPEVFAIGANTVGDIFAGTRDGISHYAPNGQILASLTLPGTGIVGLDLDGSGNLVAISADGRVFLTTEALTSFTPLLNTGGGLDLNVAFVPSPAVPEPASLALAAFAVGLILLRSLICRGQESKKFIKDNHNHIQRAGSRSAAKPGRTRRCSRPGPPCWFSAG